MIQFMREVYQEINTVKIFVLVYARPRSTAAGGKQFQKLRK